MALTMRELGFMGADPAPAAPAPAGPPSLATALMRARQKMAMIRARSGASSDDEEDMGPPARSSAPMTAPAPPVVVAPPPPPPPMLSIGGGGDLFKLLGVGAVAGGVVYILSRGLGGRR
jgi:hypothetical protein